MVAVCERHETAEEIEITPEMVEAGVHVITGYNLDPSSQPVCWPQIVRNVFQAMAARQPEPKITDEAIDDAVDFLLDFQINRGDDPFEVTRNLVACALKGLRNQRGSASA